MTTYIVRVELVKNFPNRYTLLKEAFLAEGFKKTLKSKDGQEYLLPTGNFIIKSENDLRWVLNVAMVITASLDSNAKILVTHANDNGNVWNNLETITHNS